MSYPHRGSPFDKKSSLPREFSNSVEPANLTVRSDSLHHQSYGYGRTLSDQDLSFFDFEPQVTPYQVQSTLSDLNEPDHNLTWIDTDRQLLSPPNSAVFPPKLWPNFEPLQGPASDALTTIKPANSRTNYGQVTPTDDGLSENFNAAESQPPRMQSLAPTANKKRKRTSVVIPESPSKRVSKRSCKDRNCLELLGTSQADPRNPDGNRRSKFLERNRLAASKCRQKKKQWVENLEVKARNLQAQYKQLNVVVDSLKDEILYLKVEMVRHKDCEGSEIQKCIEDDYDAFAEAGERLERLECEKPVKSGGSSSPRSDAGTDPVRPMKDLESKIHSDRRSASAPLLDDMDLAAALLQEEFCSGCD